MAMSPISKQGQGAPITLYGFVMINSKSYPIDANGHYQTDTLKAGTYDVTVMALNYESITRTIEIVADSNLQYDFSTVSNLYPL